MKIVRLRITLIDGCFQYAADAIENNGRYYYRVNNTTVEITESEYDRVIGNPHCIIFQALWGYIILLGSLKTQ
jgi:hypothetical protein